MDAAINVAGALVGVLVGSGLSYFIARAQQRRQFTADALLQLVVVYDAMWAPTPYEEFRTALERFEVLAQMAGASQETRSACRDVAIQCYRESEDSYRHWPDPDEGGGGIATFLLGHFERAREVLADEMSVGIMRGWRCRSHRTEARSISALIAERAEVEPGH